MKSKKLILLIVTVLLLSLTTPAFAASKPSTKVTAACSLPDVKIEVVVPSGTKAYLNPQKLPVKVGSTIQAAMIFSDEAHIENKSNVPITVGASVTGAVKSGSNLSLVSKTFDPAGTKTKQAFLYLQLKPTDDPTNFESIGWEDEYNEEKDIIVATTAKSKTDVLTLAAYREDENGEAKSSIRYGAFRLAGICTKRPATTSAWTSKDGVDVNIVFTFEALPYDTVVEAPAQTPVETPETPVE